MVHTVSAADPLADVPATAAAALARAVLVPVRGDLGGALERCEAVTALLDRWQDDFFAALPPEVDLEEEARYAAEAGVDLAEVEQEWESWDDDADDDDAGEDDEDEVEGQLDLGALPDGLGLGGAFGAVGDLEEALLLGHRADPQTASLDDDLVAELERELLLLPMRTRLEALMAAEALVEQWSDLMADHEKCLGHLVLAHGVHPEQLGHESLVDQHAALHAGRPEHAP